MTQAWHHDGRSAKDRGYGWQWQKLRLVILKRDGYLCRCAECQRTGALKVAGEVDHVVSKAAWLKRWGNLQGVDAPGNLSAINHDCHELKTLAERGYAQPVVVGLDGWPVDG